MRKGRFIVIEGSSESGKTTQLNLLKERLTATGYEVAVFDFPRYGEASSYFVQSYLNGSYGNSSDISAYTASLFYALDRYEASKEILQAIDEGKIVLCNRYVGSNMAHQGSKFTDPVEQRGFFVWADNLEFQLLGIPRPDINIFLRVPAEVSYELINKRVSSGTKNLKDGNKFSPSYLKKSVATYDLLCELFPKDFKAIESTKNGRLLSIPEINDKIWRYLQPILPAEKPNPSHSVVVTLGLDNAKQTLPAVINGQESITVPFRNASLLLRLHLERARPGDIQPDLRHFEATSQDFYTPGSLPPSLAQTYKQSLKTIADTQSLIADRLTTYLEKARINDRTEQYSVNELVLPLTPLAQLSNFSLNVDRSGITAVASKLLAGDSDEITWAAKQLYLFARQHWPQEFKNPLESNAGPESLNNIIAKLADEHLPLNSSADDQVKLLESYPRQEFDLLAESIYSYSNLSLAEIKEEVSDWPYQQKYDGLKQALTQPGIVSKVRYKMDIISDQLTLDELVRAVGMKQVQVQSLTPRFGYEVPRIVEDAAVDDLYNDCFDESLKLFSILQAAGRDDLTAYATLLGHKVRWQLNTDAASLKAALIPANNTVNQKVADIILEKIAELHPLMWEILSNAQVIAPSPKKNGRKRVKPAHQGTKRKPNSKK